MKRTTPQEGRPFHLFILRLYQLSFMKAGIQAFTLTVPLTLPPLISSIPLPPIYTLVSISEKMHTTVLPVWASVLVITSYLLPS